MQRFKEPDPFYRVIQAIFASTLPSATTSQDARKYPCSLSNIRLLDDVTFYIVDIESGVVRQLELHHSPYVLIWIHLHLRHLQSNSLTNFTFKVTDRRIFKGDHIYLPHHAGVGLYGPLFAVLSVHHQSICIMDIKV